MFMTFDSSDPRITAYVFGELSNEELVTFEHEMEESSELREAVEATRNVTDQLAVELIESESPRLSEERRGQVAQARVEQADAEQPVVHIAPASANHWRWRTVVTTLTVTAAACLLIATWTQRNRVVKTLGLAPARRDFSARDSLENTAKPQIERSVFSSDTESLVSQRSGKLASLEDSSKVEGGVVYGTRVVKGEGEPMTQVELLSIVETRSAPLGTSQPFQAGSVSHLSVLRGDKQAPGTEGEGQRFGLGEGPGMRGDQFDFILENRFHRPLTTAKSTFSIDVDTASYAKVRMYLMQTNSMPRPDAVRIEELINYFAYAYEAPKGETPFSSQLSVSDCPWQPTHRLVRVALQGRTVDDDRPASNLVFLIDVSGSMQSANKLPLLKAAMKMLAEQLGENDRVSMVVYAGAAGVVLPATNGADTHEIVAALERLSAGGSTNGGQGIELAYQLALDNFIPGGVNRVMLCTDGDFNVGTTGTDQLVRLAAERAKNGVQLTVLGFGMGNHNDAMLEQISNRGNGNYAFIDTLNEARKVLVEQMQGTLVTIAKDVKIQVVFNPSTVAAYRLIGYENRVMRTEDFDDDKKDAGEIGAGHRVTALYEVIPVGVESPLLAKLPVADEVKYQKREATGNSDDLLTVYVRYKDPGAETSKKLTFNLHDNGQRFGDMDFDFRFAASVASFGMLLRGSEYSGDSTYAAVLEIAGEASGPDVHGYRSEFLQMVEKARQLSDGE
jgi:Ca-activated chloride channel family protein